MGACCSCFEGDEKRAKRYGALVSGKNKSVMGPSHQGNKPASGNEGKGTRRPKTNASRRSRGSRWQSFDTRSVFSEEGLRGVDGIERIVSARDIDIGNQKSNNSDNMTDIHPPGSLIGENGIILADNMSLGGGSIDGPKDAVNIVVVNPSGEVSQNPKEQEVGDLLADVPTPQFSDKQKNLKTILNLSVDTDEANSSYQEDGKETIGSPWRLDPGQEIQLLNNVLSPRTISRLSNRKNQETPGSTRTQVSDGTYVQSSSTSNLAGEDLKAEG